MTSNFTFYEFFAGAGMVRAGLGPNWKCVFANDFDEKKGQTYRNNWGRKGELVVGDIRNVHSSSLVGTVDLAWGSFPCQDLSLAGGGAGLKGERSGTFYPFWNIMQGLISQGRGPRIIALENVCGTLTSHSGADFSAICETFSDAGYRYGALIIDASHFVPQSRQRLFIIGIREDCSVPDDLVALSPSAPFHTMGLQRAFQKLSEKAKQPWIWWNLPTPTPRSSVFSDLLEDSPLDVKWHTCEQTEKLLAIMSKTNLAKVKAAMDLKRRVVGGVYKRTRDESDGRVVRAEVRFDDIAGCLRTPNGGSSRQTIIIVDGSEIKTRLISARETARLMGLDDKYRLPTNYNEAYHLTGDGVAVPVVGFIGKYLFEPIISQSNLYRRENFVHSALLRVA